jgi:hypothetical protein
MIASMHRLFSLFAAFLSLSSTLCSLRAAGRGLVRPPSQAMRRFALFAVLFLAGLAITGRAAAEPSRPLPVALLKTEASSPLIEPRIAVFDSLLFAELASRSELILVEREDIGAALEEFRLRAGGTTASANAVHIGRWTGARIVVSARAVAHGRGLGVAARILGVETGSVIVVDTSMKSPETFADGARALADKIAATLAEKSAALVPPWLDEDAWLEILRASLKHRPTPPLAFSTHATPGSPEADDERVFSEELSRLWKTLGGQASLDPTASQSHGAVRISAEARTKSGLRHGEFASARAHVSLVLIESATGRELLRDQQTEIVLEASDALAREASLRRSARSLAARLLPALCVPVSP